MLGLGLQLGLITWAHMPRNKLSSSKKEMYLNGFLVPAMQCNMALYMYIIKRF
jgi:hypothetical protein